MNTTTEPRTVMLTIPSVPAYSFSPNSRVHWSTKAREARFCRQQLMVALSWRRDITPFCGPVKIIWTVYLPKGRKSRDTDNIVPCFKPYLDQLVTAGVLPDDSPTYIPEVPTVVQIPWGSHKGDPRIDLMITESDREAAR